MTFDSATHVFTDAPIVGSRADRLERQTFAEHVADRIVAAGGGDSVAFGLTGAWGSGKTSVLRMIEEKMPQEWAVRYFTPWAASDPASLVGEFYATISSALPAVFRRKIVKKFQAMVPIVAGAAAAIPVAGQAASSTVKEAAKLLDKSFQDQFKKASRDFVEAGIKVLVIIDDIDRLHSDELVAVLKTVRLLGSFPGVHYLLAYDQETVCDVLRTTSIAATSDRALQFLEKIVQYPFDLPPMQSAHRVRELTAALARVEAAHNLGPILTGRTQFGSLIGDFLALVPEGDLATLRTIHRLVTQFDIALTVIQPDEINAEDLLLLTFLRVRYPRLYRMLPGWKDGLLWSGSVSRQGDSSTHQLVASCFDESDDSRVAALTKLLNHIFPTVEVNGWIGSGRPSGSCRASESAYFDRYFVMGIPVGDISDKHVRAGLAQLASAGVLDDKSPLGVALADKEATDRAAEKACRLLTETMESITSANALSAALDVGRRVADFEEDSWLSARLRFPGELAGIAVERAGSRDASRVVVDELEREWGLTATVRSLHPTLSAPHDTLSEPIRLAMEDVRRRCLNACIADFEDEDPKTGSVLFHLSYLDEEGMNELGGKVQAMISGGRELDDIAARFVSTYTLLASEGPTTTANRYELGGLQLADFEKVIPRSFWKEFFVKSSGDHEKFDEHDVSFTNRKRCARQALAQLEAEGS
ncbi:P-loop NTPase fold protein [Rhodococcus sp. NPDC059234]|uniref:KAP family P-loop NTPase fold protein n=1 Tax=Rhodococcus sp. NPDC059234 TaxID=3346781 RepID=UPI00366FA5F4